VAEISVRSIRKLIFNAKSASKSIGCRIPVARSVLAEDWAVETQYL